MNIDNKRIRNIAWAIQTAHLNCSPLISIFEATALRWIYKPMTGNKNLSVEEIADLIEGYVMENHHEQ